MDTYLSEENIYQRLKEKYQQYGKLIVAYDFDETVYNNFKTKDTQFDMVTDLIKRCRPYSTLIVFTARNINDKNDYELVNKYLKDNNIPFDYINSDYNGIIPFGRKIYYNILLDDKAGLPSAYRVLNRLIEELEKGIF